MSQWSAVARRSQAALRQWIGGITGMAVGCRSMGPNATSSSGGADAHFGVAASAAHEEVNLSVYSPSTGACATHELVCCMLHVVAPSMLQCT